MKATPEPLHALQKKRNSHQESQEGGAKMAAPAFQLKASSSEPAAQRKASASNSLSPDLVDGLKATTGHDLSDVKVNYNSDKPGKMGALAFAQGESIHVAPGQEQHLAHEAAHVVQQREGRVKADTNIGGNAVNTDKHLEAEADQMGAKAQAVQKKSATGEAASPAKGANSNSLTSNVSQAKLAITGGNDKLKNQFVKRMNMGSPVKFQMDKSTGLVTPKDPKAVGKDEYTTQMLAAINDPQTVNLDLLAKSDAVLIDSFGTGEVDASDMFSGTDQMFRLNLLHFVVERFAIPNYETDKATTSSTDFGKAHQLGLDAEARYLKQMYPKKTIAFTGEGVDTASKKVDKHGDGTINYLFDFTDVEYVFKLKMKANNMTNEVLSNKVRVK